MQRKPTTCFGTGSAATNRSLGTWLNSILDAGTTKFSIFTTYVFFKNNCPATKLPTYDSFSICDLNNDGEVLYCVCPKDSHADGKATVYGKENGFSKPLVCGTWKEVKDWFCKSQHGINLHKA